eukprot:TRINITY_DN2707_c0_g1_i2.p1 TRINITY_DN2707_c0_g1~~TRINITY_DN2707_c0_g1_i2.p1  ORF type:complete len:304 (-),score=50.33 TRINITY_DN2707_c0_g1_i2:19-930(-)
MSINIFQLNTYLIPNIPFIKSKSEYQTRRGRLIADHLSQSISNYDILSLQEMWGDQLGIIDDVVVQNGHSVIDVFRSWRLGGFFDSVMNYLQWTGGLYVSVINEMPILYSGRKQFTISESNSRKGIAGVLIDTSYKWGDNTHLLLINTHTDPHHIEYQGIQVSEIHDFASGLFQSAMIENPQLDPSRCSMLITGDFNFVPQSTNYNRLFDEFGYSIRDLYLSDNITRNEVYTYDSRNTLSDISSGGFRIDYAFAVDSIDTNDGVIELAPLRCTSIEILTQLPNEEWSDHWGLTYTLTQQIRQQ